MLLQNRQMRFRRYKHNALRKNRISESGRAYSITTACQHHQPIFLARELGEIVADEIERSDRSSQTLTIAWVVMPDHMHWLFQLRQWQSLSAVVKQVKGRSSYRINRVRRSSGRVWQPGFHDHAIRKEESLQNIGNYIVQNPVRAGLVENPEDYPLWDMLWRRRGDPIRG